MSFTQNQVDNLVSAMQADLAALLSLDKKLLEEIEFYNSIGGSPTVTANPPSGSNLGITAAQVVTAIANATTITNNIATYRDSFTALLVSVPR